MRTHHQIMIMMSLNSKIRMHQISGEMQSHSLKYFPYISIWI